MSDREDLLYSKILGKVHSTSQVQPLYKDTRFLLVCFFILGVVLGYVSPATIKSESNSNIFTVLYSPFYNGVTYKEVVNGNEQGLD